MFWKNLKVFSRNKKKSRKITHIKKSHYSLGNNQESLFKRRKKYSFSPFKYIFPIVIQKQNKLFILIWIIICFTLITLFLLFSPFLQIRDIYIYRQDSIINIDQAYGNIDYIRGQNILFLDTNEIAHRLLKSQKSISSIEFDIDFPHHINIHIWSYPALFQTQEHLLLSNWVVVSKDSKQYIWIPLIKTSENIEDYAIFWNTLNTDILKNLDILITEGKKNILGFDFQNIKYYITEKELIVMHTSGGFFLFDLSSNIQQQIEKLAIYEKEEWNIQEKRYIYIDLRIPEKLFLCSFENEYDCRNNIKHIYGNTIFEDLSPESSELIQ